MYEMGLRRLFQDAEDSRDNRRLVEEIRDYFNGDPWDRIQNRYAWWIMGVLRFMEEENCSSVEVMTERLQDKIRTSKTETEVMDVRLIFDGENWLTIQAKFYWWMCGLERYISNRGSR
jgi:hypothetical protein